MRKNVLSVNKPQYYVTFKFVIMGYTLGPTGDHVGHLSMKVMTGSYSFMNSEVDTKTWNYLQDIIVLKS